MSTSRLNVRAGEPRSDAEATFREEFLSLVSQVGLGRDRAVALVEATGRAAVADDTGLFVDALGGSPGVWSARYAGVHASYADNRAKLLAALAELPPGKSQRAEPPSGAKRVSPMNAASPTTYVTLSSVCPGVASTRIDVRPSGKVSPSSTSRSN